MAVEIAASNAAVAWASPHAIVHPHRLWLCSQALRRAGDGEQPVEASDTCCFYTPAQ